LEVYFVQLGTYAYRDKKLRAVSLCVCTGILQYLFTVEMKVFSTGGIGAVTD
jgi:hypothetical protein